MTERNFGDLAWIYQLLAEQYHFEPWQVDNLTMQQVCILLPEVTASPSEASAPDKTDEPTETANIVEEQSENDEDAKDDEDESMRKRENRSRSHDRRARRLAGKYSVALLADVPGYAYHLRATALAKHAPDDFDVKVLYWSNAPKGSLIQSYDLHDFDLIINFDYQSCGLERRIVKAEAKTRLIISHNRDSRSLLEKWPDTYNPMKAIDGFVICNNREVFEHHGRLARTCNISNGIDADLWNCDVPIEERQKRVLWCGGANPKKGKGWQEVLEPLQFKLEERGFETDFRPFHDKANFREWLKPQPAQRAWYNSGFAILCASNSEGTPNTTLEGGYCGCVPVTTPVGNVLEFGTHLENCILCERDVDTFVTGIEYAWAHRKQLSDAIRETLRGWTYGRPGDRAMWFYALFRRLLRDGGEAIEPFTYQEKHWTEI